jgi:methyl coenzyme M reductase alpha subunit
MTNSKTNQPAKEAAAAETKKFSVVLESSKSTLHFTNVVARKVEAGDMLTAQRISGANEGNAFTLAIIAQVCTFDGKKLTYEDLQHLPFEDFLELQSQLMDLQWMGSKEQLSSFVEKYS